MGFWLTLLLAVVFNVIAYFLAPKPKIDKPPEVKDLDDPTADAGRPIPVLFGTIPIRGLNVLHFSDKSKFSKEVPA